MNDLKIKVSDDTSCSKWILCINGVALEQQCDLGTLFNPVVGNCDLTQNVQCQINVCSNVPNGIVASPMDCSSYYLCAGRELLSVERCQNGLQFDHLTLRCTINATCFPGTGPIAAVPFI